jgi:PhzF family phenazine biosynthesis protein
LIVASFRFKQVDVFTSRPFLGNPVAVVLGADGLDERQMQSIAAWTNLSETTFVMQPTNPEADYRLRIFSPAGELPFAGHPTVGSAHAVLESGVVGQGASSLCQECIAGVLPLRVEGSGPERKIFVQVPETRLKRDLAGQEQLISQILGAPVASSPAPRALDVGPIWVVAQIEKTETVRGLEPDMAAMAKFSRELGVSGITVFSLDEDGDAAAHVRTFAPAMNIPEDPVCGSASATIGAYLAQTGLLAQTGERYAVSQGTELGRDGRIFVSVQEDGRRIEIGGCAVTVVDGTIEV